MMPENDTSATLLRQFLLAGVLLTRLPFPRLADDSFAHSPRAVWAYPLVGLIIGGIGATTGSIAMWSGLPPMLAAGIALAAMMLSTGAMHEDGLADTVDGFWGGHTPERRLEIMRDSQIGTYGVLALLINTGLRWGAVSILLTQSIWPLIAAASLSRAFMPILMAHLPHARSDGLSHSVGAPQMQTAMISVVIGVGIALFFAGTGAFSILIAVGLLVTGVNRVARAKIGGQTGDVLGAAQQLCEVLILLMLIA